MLVSVIILAYNQEEYIAQTIESVLSQQCDFDWEILIADDASTDRTPQICEEFRRRHPDRIRLLLRDKNMGVLDNYYDAVFAARGKYISDLGGDDIWIDPHKLAKEAAYLESHPGCTLVHTAWNYLNNEDGSHRLPDFKQPQSYDFLSLLRKDSIMQVHLCTAMYRRDIAIECYRECPEVFAAKDVIFEDYQLIVALAAKGTIDSIADDTLRYRLTPGSLSNSNRPARDFELYYCTLQVARRLQKHHKVPDAEMEQTYLRLIRFLQGLNSRIKSSENTRRIEAAARELPVRLPLRSQIRSILHRCGLYI